MALGVNRPKPCRKGHEGIPPTAAPMTSQRRRPSDTDPALTAAADQLRAALDRLDAEQAAEMDRAVVGLRRQVVRIAAHPGRGG
jgi:hypothetical protein